MGLLSLLPLLAAFDRFGTREITLTATNDEVGLTIEHSPRVRYGLPTRVRIQVKALRGSDAGPVAVRVESEFLNRFAQLSLVPLPSRTDARHHTFVLPASDDEGVILIELEPERYGPVRGRVAAALTGGGAPAEIDLKAFAYP